MTTKVVRSGAIGLVAVAGMIVTYVAGYVRAAGIPAKGALSYSGTLTDQTGAPLTGKKNLQLMVWNQPTGGTLLCQVTPTSVDLVAGRFKITLPDDCVAVARANPDIWTEVLVNSVSLGRKKIGAVPFAVEADRASVATGALRTELSAIDERLKQAEQRIARGIGNGLKLECDSTLQMSERKVYADVVATIPAEKKAQGHIRTGGGCDAPMSGGNSGVAHNPILLKSRPHETDGWHCQIGDQANTPTPTFVVAYVTYCRVLPAP